MGELNPDGTPKGDAGKDQVPKVDLDAKVAELDKTKQELEDMRLEVFSPDYMAFLDSKDKGGDKKPDDKPPVDEDLTKLTPKQLYDRAKEDAKKELKVDIDKARDDAVTTVGKEQRQRDVAAFSRTHEDFETYRPIMYGLSLDPKNKDLTLAELYDKSKEHVARIHTTPSPEEKARQQKLVTEKPGGSSESLEKYQKMTPEEIGKESLEEVKKELGPIPKI